MAVATVQDLLHACREHHILTDTQWGAIAAIVPSLTDSQALARELVQRGFLTAWQANQVIKGRARELLLGSYLLLEKLGEGGMGAVYKARHRFLGRLVAVKLIRKERLDTELAIRRFRREIEAAAQLSHPNIVLAYDADQVEGTHFFVMEYVEGRDLGKVVKERGWLPVNEACEYIRQAALGLQHAFERGLVHRDIKPSNLLLSPAHGLPSVGFGTIKLLDMGLARLERTADDRSSTLTQEGAIMGTPDYIAPEQARDSHTADIRADLYSLGCTLYHLLAGRVPFPGGTLTEKLLKHQMDTPTPLRQLRPEVPEPVARLVEKLMAKRPADRYQTPAELVAAMEEILPSPGRQRSSASVASSATHSGVHTLQLPENPFADLDLAVSDTIATGQTPRERVSWKRPHWGLIAASAGGVLLSGLLIVALVLSGRKDTDKTSDNLESKKPAEPKAVRKLSPKQQELEEAKQREAAEQKRRAEAEEALKQLVAKAGNAKVTFAEFAKDVAAFKEKYGGTPAAIKAAELLMKLPSPLDALDPKKLPQDCIDSWRAVGREPPGELVGVLGEHRRRHWGPVVCAAYSPDGKQIASAGADGVICLWDADTMQQRSTLRYRDRGLTSIAFSAKGDLLAAGSGPDATAVTIWDLKSGKEMVPERHGRALDLAFSPDGRWLAVAHELYGIRIYEAPAWTLHKNLKAFPWNAAIAFSKDGKKLVGTGNDGTNAPVHVVKVWDVETGDELAHHAVNSPLPAVGVSGDGRSVLAYALDGQVRCWDLATNRELPPIQRPQGGNFQRISPTGRYAISAHSDPTLIWETETWKELVRIPGNVGGYRNSAFSSDERRVVFAGNDGTVRLWDVATGKEVQPLKGPIGPTNSVDFSPDCGTLLTAGQDVHARLWNVKECKIIRELEGSRAQFLPDGVRCLAQGGDNVPKVFKIDGEELFRLGGEGDWTLTGDGSRTVVWHGDSFRLADLNSGRELSELRRVDKQVAATVALSDGQRFVTAGPDGALGVWSMETGRLLKELHGNWTAAYILAASPDGRTVLASTRGPHQASRLIDIETGREIHQWPSAGPHQTALAISPNGKLAATAVVGKDGAPIVSLYDAGSGKPVREWQLLGSINALAFANDGRHLATANGNGTVYILRIAEGPPRALSAEEAKKQQADEAKRLGVPVQITNSIGMKLNPIPAGKFLMGSPENEPGRQANEGPQHKVTISRSFHIGVYEVTQAEFEKVTGKNPSKFNKANGGGPDHPVEMVSWDDAVAFCKKLSEMPEEKQAGRVYRLPTEAEWEYACRAGTRTAYSFGDDASKLADYGWFPANSQGKPHPVGQKRPNRWGLHDMHGNVWEWCADYFDGTYYQKAPRVNPTGPALGAERTFRGGSFEHSPSRAASRYDRGWLPDQAFPSIGFRVVCDVQPAVAK
jgi:serine/threonine-protein kinase